MPMPEDRKLAHRDFVVRNNDLKERQRTHGDGYTLNCPGCISARQGTVPRNHNDKCRAKWRNRFLSDPEFKQRVTHVDARLGRSDDVAQQDQADAAPFQLPGPDVYPGPNDDHMDEDNAYEKINRMIDQMPDLGDDAGDSAEAAPSDNPNGDVDLGMISNIASEFLNMVVMLVRSILHLGLMLLLRR